VSNNNGYDHQNPRDRCGFCHQLDLDKRFGLWYSKSRFKSLVLCGVGALTTHPNRFPVKEGNMVFQDLSGQKFYQLTFRKFVGRGKNGQAIWLCECDCGNFKEVFAHHVKTGNVQSCGCKALIDNRSNSSTRFGGTNTPEWTSYHAAKKRCNPKHANKYPDYAGRGIEFRLGSFQSFLEHIGPRPEPKFDYSLERIDNDGHYEYGNVRWATKQEQARNRRCDNCAALKARIKELEDKIASLEEKSDFTDFPICYVCHGTDKYCGLCNGQSRQE